MFLLERCSNTELTEQNIIYNLADGRAQLYVGRAWFYDAMILMVTNYVSLLMHALRSTQKLFPANYTFSLLVWIYKCVGVKAALKKIDGI